MSDSDTLCDTSDEEIRGEEWVSVGGKAPRVGPIKKYIPTNGIANRVLPVSDEAFKMVDSLAHGRGYTGALLGNKMPRAALGASVDRRSDISNCTLLFAYGF